METKNGFDVLGIEHIGVAVESINEMKKFYKNALGLEPSEEATLEEQKINTCLIPIGDSNIELLEATSPKSIIHKFIQRRGEGIHHISLTVDNLEEAIESLQSQDVKIIDDFPMRGIKGRKVAFIHPDSTGGILMELVEKL